MVSEETTSMKVKDLFETSPLLTGRTEIDTQSKLNVGLVWSASGTAFLSQTQAAEYQRASTGLFIDNTQNGAILPVHLPNGAKITSVIVYGLDETEQYELFRQTINTHTQESIGALTNMGTEQTTITNATVDNVNYSYLIATTALDAADIIYGARIIYTI